MMMSDTEEEGSSLERVANIKHEESNDMHSEVEIN